MTISRVWACFIFVLDPFFQASVNVCVTLNFPPPVEVYYYVHTHPLAIDCASAAAGVLLAQHRWEGGEPSRGQAHAGFTTGCCSMDHLPARDEHRHRGMGVSLYQHAAILTLKPAAVAIMTKLA
jgi:hypothetical protein